MKYLNLKIVVETPYYSLNGQESLTYYGSFNCFFRSGISRRYFNLIKKYENN